MITLSIIELLYLVLIFFTVIIGTLLSLVLLRVLRILWVIAEITDYYYSLKKYWNYAVRGIQELVSQKEKTEEPKNPVL